MKSSNFRKITKNPLDLDYPAMIPYRFMSQSKNAAKIFEDRAQMARVGHLRVTLDAKMYFIYNYVVIYFQAAEQPEVPIAKKKNTQ